MTLELVPEVEVARFGKQCQTLHLQDHRLSPGVPKDPPRSSKTGDFAWTKKLQFDAQITHRPTCEVAINDHCQETDFVLGCLGTILCSTTRSFNVDFKVFKLEQQ